MQRTSRSAVDGMPCTTKMWTESWSLGAHNCPHATQGWRRQPPQTGQLHAGHSARALANEEGRTDSLDGFAHGPVVRQERLMPEAASCAHTHATGRQDIRAEAGRLHNAVEPFKEVSKKQSNGAHQRPSSSAPPSDRHLHRTQQCTTPTQPQSQTYPAGSKRRNKATRRTTPRGACMQQLGSTHGNEAKRSSSRTQRCLQQKGRAGQHAKWNREPLSSATCSTLPDSSRYSLSLTAPRCEQQEGQSERCAERHADSGSARMLANATNSQEA